MSRISKPEKQAKNRLTPKMIASQWKPGQTGNKSGRPPRFKVLAEYVRSIGEEIAEKKTGLTRLEKMLRRLYDDGTNGKVEAARLLLERGWGKPPVEIITKSASEKKAELLHMAHDANIDINNDPVLSAILELFEEQEREENGGIDVN